MGEEKQEKKKTDVEGLELPTVGMWLHSNTQRFSDTTTTVSTRAGGQLVDTRDQKNVQSRTVKFHARADIKRFTAI